MIESSTYNINPAPRTVIDVGGIVGLFSFWARANLPEAGIHAYEPNPSLQDDLSANCARFDARVYGQAVAGREERASLEARGGVVRAGATGDAKNLNKPILNDCGRCLSPP